MKITVLFSIMLAFAILGLSGCRTAPIQNVENAPVQVNRENYTLEDVEKAIIRAGTCQGWQMYKERPGLIKATWSKHDYSAEANITYNTREYSIRYRDSRNLDYKPGQIHENYNVWVQDLNDAIRRELLAQ